MRGPHHTYKRAITAGAVLGAVILLASMLWDGHITAPEWMRLGTVLFIGCLIGLSHMLWATPQQVREHDYGLGFENGRRYERRCTREHAVD